MLKSYKLNKVNKDTNFISCNISIKIDLQKLAETKHMPWGRKKREEIWWVMREITDRFQKTPETKIISGEEDLTKDKLHFWFTKVGVNRAHSRRPSLSI